MTSPLRFRERSPLANRIPPDLADFGGSAGCDARVDSFTVRQEFGSSASVCESPAPRVRMAGRLEYDRSA